MEKKILKYRFIQSACYRYINKGTYEEKTIKPKNSLITRHK